MNVDVYKDLLLSPTFYTYMYLTTFGLFLKNLFFPEPTGLSFLCLDVNCVLLAASLCLGATCGAVQILILLVSASTS